MIEKEPFGYQKSSLDDQDLTQKIDRVDELVSLLLDDELAEQDVRELESLLTSSAEARGQYVGMIQLHTDLIDYYNPQSIPSADSPILANLTQSIDILPPTTQHPAD